MRGYDITGNWQHERMALKLGSAFSSVVLQSLSNYSRLMFALDFAVGLSCEVVVTGLPDEKDTRAMLIVIQQRFFPNKVLLLRPTGQESQTIERIAQCTRLQ